MPKVLDAGMKRCYIVGTIYVDMQLKPNVLKDLTQEVWCIVLWTDPIIALIINNNNDNNV